MGMSCNSTTGFRPATDTEREGFGPDSSALAHYISRQRGAAPTHEDDHDEQIRRRETLSRLIAGAFD